MRRELCRRVLYQGADDAWSVLACDDIERVPIGPFTRGERRDLLMQQEALRLSRTATKDGSVHPNWGDQTPGRAQA
jgi:hypothetical protein